MASNTRLLLEDICLVVAMIAIQVHGILADFMSQAGSMAEQTEQTTGLAISFRHDIREFGEDVCFGTVVACPFKFSRLFKAHLQLFSFDAALNGFDYEATEPTANKLQGGPDATAQLRDSRELEKGHEETK